MLFSNKCEGAECHFLIKVKAWAKCHFLTKVNDEMLFFKIERGAVILHNFKGGYYNLP